MKTAILSFLILYSQSGFAQNSYKIGVYEFIQRFVHPDDKEVKRYEIRNLFIKSDTTWNVNSTYFKKDTFYQIVNGIIGTKLHGLYRTDTSSFFPEKEVYYLPSPRLQNEKRLRKVLNSATENHIWKVSFLSNNKSFRRINKLKKYSPNEQDLKLIKDNFYGYIESQFFTYCEKDLLNERKKFADSLGFTFLDTANIVIDKQNTFLTSENGKLISFITPYFYLCRNVYPFNKSCFREDNGYEGLRITCYINSQNQVTFLQDELTYLEHGDFDNDGKDEFLFWYSIFNHDGYILYYNDFKYSTKFKWSYH